MTDTHHYRIHQVTRKLIEVNAYGLPILRRGVIVPETAIRLSGGPVGSSEIPRAVDLRLLPSERRRWV